MVSTLYPWQNSPRALALAVLRQVLGERAFASQAIDQALTTHALMSEDNRLFTQLVYGTLREMGWLDACLHPYLNFEKTRLGLLCLLRLAAYQMLCLSKIPDYAVLNESINLAKRKFGIGASKLTSAVLRRLQQDKSKLIEEKNLFLKNTNQDINNREVYDKYEYFYKYLSLPCWLWKRWLKRYKTQALGLALSFSKTPKIYLRCNLSRISSESCLDSLKKLGFQGTVTSSASVIALQTLDWQKLQPLLYQGVVSIQDLGSFQIVEKLSPQVGDQGIDACAGKGIKATALAELLGEQGLVAVYEPISWRLQELESNFRRLGLKNFQVIADKSFFIKQKTSWDWLLVDAPCSGLGTLGRKPELRWKLKESDIKAHSLQQLEILTQWAPLVRTGGRLVYAVCSLEPEEGTEVIQNFLYSHKEWMLKEQGEIWPGENAGADGFYWAKLIKKEIIN